MPHTSANQKQTLESENSSIVSDIKLTA